MPPLVLDVCSLLRSQLNELKRLGLVTMQGLAPNVQRVLFSDKVDISGFLIPLDLVELPSWCISLRRGGKLLPLRYHLLPEFVQWEILRGRYNTIFLNSLSSLRNEDLSWLAELLHSVHELAGVNHIIINSKSLPSETFSAFLNRLSSEISISITNYNYRVSNHLKEFEDIEMLLRRNSKLRWTITYSWLCKNIYGASEGNIPLQFRRMRGSLSGIITSLPDLTNRLIIANNITNEDNITTEKQRKLERDFERGLPVFVYQKDDVDILSDLFNLLPNFNQELFALNSSPRQVV